MISNSKKPFINPWGDDNHPEKLNQAPTSMKQGFQNQLKGLFSPDKIMNQILGTPTSPETTPLPTKKEGHPIRSNETLIFSREKRESERQVQQETEILLQQLKNQIKLLEKAEKSLSAEVAKVKVEQAPQKSGIYYLRFFEWLIGVVRNLRMKVEEGRMWLSAMNTKRKKRLGYWQMYKKHGTTFGLSYERSLATQTG